MERLRDFDARSKQPSPFPFTFNSLVSRLDTSKAAADIHLHPAPPSPIANVTQSHIMDRGSVKLPSQTEISTQTNMNDKPIFQDLRIMENKVVAVQACPPEEQLEADQADRDRWTKAMTARTMFLETQLMKYRAKEDRQKKSNKTVKARQDETQQHLLTMADILLTNSDILTDSAATLSRRLNDVARDIIDAGITIKGRETEIGALSDQLRAMELSFDVAHEKLQKAQLITANAIDSGALLTHHLREIENLMQALHGVGVMMGGQDIGAWDLEKIDAVLEKLDSIWNRNENNYNSPHVTQAIYTLGQRFRDVHFHPRYAYLLGPEQDNTALLQRFKDKDNLLEKKEVSKTKPKGYYQRGREEAKENASPLNPSPNQKPSDERSTRYRSMNKKNENVQWRQHFMIPTALHKTTDTVSESQPRKIVTMRYCKNKLTIPQLIFLESIHCQCKGCTGRPAWGAPSALSLTPVSCHDPSCPCFAASEVPEGCGCIPCAVSSWARDLPTFTLEDLNNAFDNSGGLNFLHAKVVGVLKYAPEHLKKEMPTVQDVGDWVDDILRGVLRHDAS